MSEDILSIKAREALKRIRDWMMQYGKFPSVRDLAGLLDYRSPRSAMLILSELEENGFLERKGDGGYRVIKDLEENEQSARTVAVPLVGNVACGMPLLAEENVEAFYPVSTTLAKPGFKYFLLRAKGDSMNRAGIEEGDLILVRQQPVADNGQQIVALVDDEATVKEFYQKENTVTLMPKSDNPIHQPIILTRDFRIQGVVVATIPRFNH